MLPTGVLLTAAGRKAPGVRDTWLFSAVSSSLRAACTVVAAMLLAAGRVAHSRRGVGSQAVRDVAVQRGEERPEQPPPPARPSRCRSQQRHVERPLPARRRISAFSIVVSPLLRWISASRMASLLSAGRDATSPADCSDELGTSSSTSYCTVTLLPSVFGLLVPPETAEHRQPLDVAGCVHVSAVALPSTVRLTVYRRHVHPPRPS